MKMNLKKFTALLLSLMMILQLLPSYATEPNGVYIISDSYATGDMPSKDQTEGTEAPDGTDNVSPENQPKDTDPAKTAPEVILGTETAPSQDGMTFAVQYVVDGEFTYDGKSVVIDREENVTGNPSSTQVKQIKGCSTDGNSRKWDSGTNTLTFFPVPVNSKYLLEYYYIYTDNSGNEHATIFQEIQNGEGILSGDRIQLQDFITYKDGDSSLNGGEREVNYVNGKEIKQIFPLTVPTKYLFLDKTITVNGHNYSLEYNGYNYNGNGPITNSSSITFDYQLHGDHINLYYKMKASGTSEETATPAGNTSVPTPTPPAASRKSSIPPSRATASWSPPWPGRRESPMRASPLSCAISGRSW